MALLIREGQPAAPFHRAEPNEVRWGGAGCRTIWSRLKFFLLTGGFLRALFESQKLQRNFGRVAQQPGEQEKLAAVLQPAPARRTGEDKPNPAALA